jgi:hypothetical protein
VTTPGPDDEERFRRFYAVHFDALLSYAVRRVAGAFLVAWRRVDDLPPGALQKAQVDDQAIGLGKLLDLPDEPLQPVRCGDARAHGRAWTGGLIDAPSAGLTGYGLVALWLTTAITIPVTARCTVVRQHRRHSAMMRMALAAGSGAS